MDYTTQIAALQAADAQVQALITAALATDAANQAMQAALQAARASLAAAQAAIIAPVPVVPPVAVTDGTVTAFPLEALLDAPVADTDMAPCPEVTTLPLNV